MSYQKSRKIPPGYQKRYRHRFCYECGRYLPTVRHGHVKFCSEVCKMIYRRKYRMAWYRQGVLTTEVRRKGAIVTNFKRWGHKPHDQNNHQGRDTTKLE